MLKIILVGIIIALVYSQPDLRLTVADWLRVRNTNPTAEIEGCLRVPLALDGEGKTVGVGERRRRWRARSVFPVLGAE